MRPTARRANAPRTRFGSRRRRRSRRPRRGSPRRWRSSAGRAGRAASRRSLPPPPRSPSDRPRAGFRRGPRVPRTRPRAADGRRRGDHLADRARVVEHVAVRRAQRPEVELLGAAQAVLLGHGEHELQPGRARGRGVARGELDQNGDRRLVVGPEDRLARGCETPRRRARPRSRRRAGRCRGGRRRRPTRRPRPGRVAIRLPAPARAGSAESSSRTSTPSSRSSPSTVVGDRPLSPGRARRLAQTHEAVEHPLVAHPPACSSAWARASGPMKFWIRAIRPVRSVDQPARRLVEVDAALAAAGHDPAVRDVRIGTDRPQLVDPEVPRLELLVDLADPLPHPVSAPCTGARPAPSRSRSRGRARRPRDCARHRSSAARCRGSVARPRPSADRLCERRYPARPDARLRLAQLRPAGLPQRDQPQHRPLLIPGPA